MHYHDATLKVPEGDQVDSDIYETSLNQFVSTKLAKIINDIKVDPSIYHQDVALEVPEGDLVNLDIHKISLNRFVSKNYS